MILNDACSLYIQVLYNLSFKCFYIWIRIFCRLVQARKIKLCRGQFFSNADVIMFFVSDVQYSVPIKLCKTTGSICLFKNHTGLLMPEKVKLKKHYIWDILEVDWKENKVKFNGNLINLPMPVTIKFWDKFKVICMMERQPLLFHLMLKQGSKLVYNSIKRFSNRKHLKLKSIITEMACEISPIYWFALRVI